MDTTELVLRAESGYTANPKNRKEINFKKLKTFLKNLKLF